MLECGLVWLCVKVSIDIFITAHILWGPSRAIGRSTWVEPRICAKVHPHRATRKLMEHCTEYSGPITGSRPESISCVLWVVQLQEYMLVQLLSCLRWFFTPFYSSDYATCKEVPIQTSNMWFWFLQSAVLWATLRSKLFQEENIIAFWN